MNTNTQEHQAVADVLSRLRPLIEKRDRLQRESDDVFTASSPYSSRRDGPSLSLADQLRARARVADLDRELAIAAADVADVERTLERAHAVARAAHDAEILDRQRPLAAKLDKLIRVAADVNRQLQAVDADATSGRTCAWSALGDDDSPVEAWRAHLRTLGAL